MPKQRTLLVAQSGGATAVINASLAGVVDAALASGEYGRVLGARNGIEGVLQEHLVDLTDLEPTLRNRLRRTPSSALGTGRYKLQDDEVDTCIRSLARLGVSAFVLIGGNDSADTANRIHHRSRDLGIDIQAVAVPKTVDNDLEVTDHCPGYGSLARALGNVVRDATWDTLASPMLYPVKVIEVMGRDAGWVAAAGAIGFDLSEGDLSPIVLVPEQPPADADDVVSLVAEDIASRGWSVVVIPETLRTSAGSHFGGEVPEYVDPHGHPYFASAGSGLARTIADRLGVRARAEKPGSFLRMSTAMASEVDRDEAYALGAAAARNALDGRGGTMPVLSRRPGSTYACDIETAPLSEIANNVRQLPEAFIPAGRRGLTPAFRDWAMPILGEKPFPDYARIREDGHSDTN